MVPMSRYEDDFRPRSGPVEEKDNTARTCLWIAVIFAFVGTATIVGLGVFVYYSFLAPLDVEVRAESIADRKTSISAGLDPATATLQAIDPTTRAELVAMIEALNDETLFVGGSALMKLIDADRFYERTFQSGHLNGATSLEVSQLKNGMEGWVFGPLSGSEYQLTAMTLSPDGNSAEVLGFFDHRVDSGEPVRFLLEKINGDWKFVDWQEVNTGLWESDLIAMQYRAPGESIGTLYDKLTAASERADEYEYEQAKVHLLTALAYVHRIQPEARDVARYYIAANYTYIGEWEQAARVAEEITDREQTPGAEQILAKAALMTGEYAETLALAEQYRNHVGPTPAILMIQGEATAALGDKAASHRHYLSAYLLSPTNWSMIYPCLNSGEELDLSSMLDSLQRLDALPKGLPLLADELISRKRVADLHRFENKLAGMGADKQVRDKVARELAWLEGDDELAAKLSFDAMELTTDEYEAEEIQMRYFEAMTNLGKPLEAMQNSPDKFKAFVALMDDNYTGERNIDYAHITPLLENLGGNWNEHPQFVLLFGEMLIDSKDYREAANTFQLLIRDADAADPEDEKYYGVKSRARAGLMKLPLYYIDREDFHNFPEDSSWQARTLANRMLHSEFADFLKLQRMWESELPDNMLVKELKIRQLIKRGSYEIAEPLCEAAFDTSPDDYDFVWIAPLWLEAAEQNGSLQQVCRRLINRDDFAEYCLSMLANPTHIEALIQADHVERWSKSADAMIAIIAHYSNHQDDEAVVAWCDRVSPDAFEGWDSYDLDSMHVQHFTALMHLGRQTEAAQLADGLREEKADPVWSVRAAVARNDFRPILDDVTSYENAYLDQLYSEEVCSPVLMSDAARPFREALPPTTPDLWYTPSLVLGAAEWRPGAITLAATLRQNLTKPLTVEPFPQDPINRGHRFIINYDGERFAAYFSRSSWWRFNPISEMSTRKRQEASHYALAIGPINGYESATAQMQHQVRELLRAYIQSDIEKPETMVVYDASSYSLMSAERFLADFPETATDQHKWPYAQVEVSASVMTLPWEFKNRVTQRVQRLSHQILPKFRASPPASDGSPSDSDVIVTIRVGSAPMFEYLNVRVVAARSGSWGGIDMQGRMLSTSLLFPGLKEGERIDIPSSELWDWHIANEPENTARKRAEDWFKARGQESTNYTEPPAKEAG